MHDKSEGLRVGVLDIETTGLNADYGYTLCVCIKEVDWKGGVKKGKIHTLRIDDKRNPDKTSDKWLIQETVKLMNEFDLIVHWYGSRFDIPFINTRCIKYRLATPIRQFRRDLCYVARGSFKLRNNHLRTWGGFLFPKSGKTAITEKHWFGAIRGEKASMDYVVKHCELDVIETEKVYRRFLPVLSKKLRKK